VSYTFVGKSLFQYKTTSTASIKSTETRNDGITLRKSLLWHLLQHSSVSTLACYKPFYYFLSILLPFLNLS